MEVIEKSTRAILDSRAVVAITSEMAPVRREEAVMLVETAEEMATIVVVFHLLAVLAKKMAHSPLQEPLTVAGSWLISPRCYCCCFTWRKTPSFELFE